MRIVYIADFVNFIYVTEKEKNGWRGFGSSGGGESG